VRRKVMAVLSAKFVYWYCFNEPDANTLLLHYSQITISNPPNLISIYI